MKASKIRNRLRNERKRREKRSRQQERRIRPGRNLVAVSTKWQPVAIMHPGDWDQPEPLGRYVWAKERESDG
jgi:hypothetical protein